MLVVAAMHELKFKSWLSAVSVCWFAYKNKQKHRKKENRQKGARKQEQEERLKEYGRESRESPRHPSRAAGCVRAQDASLCFNSVVSLWSSSSLLGNKNILVFPPNERSGGSQMCGRGGGGGSSPLRLN